MMTETMATCLSLSTLSSSPSASTRSRSPLLPRPMRRRPRDPTRAVFPLSLALAVLGTISFGAGVGGDPPGVGLWTTPGSPGTTAQEAAPPACAPGSRCLAACGAAAERIWSGGSGGGGGAGGDSGGTRAGAGEVRGCPGLVVENSALRRALADARQLVARLQRAQHEWRGGGHAVAVWGRPAQRARPVEKHPRGEGAFPSRPAGRRSAWGGSAAAATGDGNTTDGTAGATSAGGAWLAADKDSAGNAANPAARAVDTADTADAADATARPAAALQAAGAQAVDRRRQLAQLPKCPDFTGSIGDTASAAWHDLTADCLLENRIFIKGEWNLKKVLRIRTPAGNNPVAATIDRGRGELGFFYAGNHFAQWRRVLQGLPRGALQQLGPGRLRGLPAGAVERRRRRGIGRGLRRVPRGKVLERGGGA